MHSHLLRFSLIWTFAIVISHVDLSQANTRAIATQKSNRTSRAFAARRDVGPLAGSSFANVVTYGSGGFGARAVAVADINLDGAMDLIVVNPCASSSDCSQGTLGLLLGNGDGTFQPAVVSPLSGLTNGSINFSAFVAAADLNGDGKPDLVVTDYCGSGCQAKSVSVLLGNGDGTFRTAVAYDTGGLFPSSVAVADVNEDGVADLTATNGCSDSQCMTASVGVMSGNGDGTFKKAVTYSLGSGTSGASSVAVADVSGDGKADLLVTSQCGETPVCTPTGPPGAFSVLLNKGDGTFQLGVVQFTAGTFTDFVTVGDLNGDGKPDVVIANYCASGDYCFSAGSVEVLLGNGDGTFQTSVDYPPGGFGTISAALGDVDGDGNLDVLASNECPDLVRCGAFGYTTGDVGVLQGNGNGTFQPVVTYDSAGYYDSWVAAADVNGDGRRDLLTTNRCGDNYLDCSFGTVGVLLNTSISFGLVPSIAEMSLSPGQSGSATITIFANGGLDPQSLTNWTCTGLPANTSCTFGTIDANNQISMTVTTTATVSLLQPYIGGHHKLLYALLLPGLFGLIGMADSRVTRRLRLVALIPILCVPALWVACGGGGNGDNGGGNGNNGGGTSARTSVVTISATSGTLKPTTTIVLTIQ